MWRRTVVASVAALLIAGCGEGSPSQDTRDGAVNVAPDSFCDGGLFVTPERAIEHARRLAADGADLLDVGGESTRPGARAVSAEEELARVAPVLAGLDGVDAAISIDTSKVAV